MTTYTTCQEKNTSENLKTRTILCFKKMKSVLSQICTNTKKKINIFYKVKYV
ncbi:hypothetical protein PBCV1_a167aR [Paramecium bursaria Chlorella virus 1]|uniref:Uncharacterized protein n=1 Tax=Paramecium bursaria Chlorella virus 1 TaxID=10506 RepID=F8TTY9_PBCV1|nr:hypothetical protein PBCV1_a167aR [Paramecium bursaria Chlorella virus 1]AEI70050.1 hypothetical protein [Paramecium bursaria Chlorella virus 1]